MFMQPELCALRSMRQPKMNVPVFRFLFTINLPMLNGQKLTGGAPRMSVSVKMVAVPPTISYGYMPRSTHLASKRLKQIVENFAGAVEGRNDFGRFGSHYPST